jgi:hypothetical protein
MFNGFAALDRQPCGLIQHTAGDLSEPVLPQADGIVSVVEGCLIELDHLPEHLFVLTH